MRILAEPYWIYIALHILKTNVRSVTYRRHLIKRVYNVRLLSESAIFFFVFFFFLWVISITYNWIFLKKALFSYSSGSFQNFSFATLIPKHFLNFITILIHFILIYLDEKTSTYQLYCTIPLLQIKPHCI